MFKYKDISKISPRNDLPKMKDGKYIIIPDGYKSIGTYWIHLHVNGNNASYFDSLRVKYFQKKSIDNKTIKTNIYKIKAYDSIMC